MNKRIIEKIMKKLTMEYLSEFKLREEDFVEFVNNYFEFEVHKNRDNLKINDKNIISKIKEFFKENPDKLLKML